MESLAIQNFKCIKSLHIEGLEKVNLFTGRNNTGKSTLLEGVMLYHSHGDIKQLVELLASRGEINSRIRKDSEDFEQQNINILSSLFSGRNIEDKSSKTITIGPGYNGLFGPDFGGDETLTITIIKYYNQAFDDDDDYIRRRNVVVNDEDVDKLSSTIDLKYGLQIRKDSENQLIPLDTNRLYSLAVRRNSNKSSPKAQAIKSGSIDSDLNSILWDAITLTDKESYVIEALKIIEPNIERIAFVAETGRSRTAVVKLAEGRNVVPIESMGDGINRILSIILAAVNSENSILVIDEFENGLHYTVQDQLWNIIFRLAEDLNIQVFATTHSRDCVQGFEEILNDRHFKGMGKVFRLEKKTDNIIATSFNSNELQIVVDEDIEIR